MKVNFDRSNQSETANNIVLKLIFGHVFMNFNFIFKTRKKGTILSSAIESCQLIQANAASGCIIPIEASYAHLYLRRLFC